MNIKNKLNHITYKKIKMYRSNKVTPMLNIKNLDLNNPIHARMMENVRVVEYGRQQSKIRPANLPDKNNIEKKHQYHYLEEEEHSVI